MPHTVPAFPAPPLKTPMSGTDGVTDKTMTAVEENAAADSDGAQPGLVLSETGAMQQNGADIVDDDMDDDDDEDDHRLIINAEVKPRKISEKKRANIAVFDNWINQHKDELLKASKPQPGETGENDDSFARSTYQGERVIEGAREYQIELFERAKKKNIIAVLDTGTGKTLISILLIRHIIELELGARAQGQDPRISFFLVDKVALVWQQTNHLEANLDFPIIGLYGNAVDHLWKASDYWTRVFRENMVVVCTAEILYKCLHHSYINMRQINLLVFDEAHHTKKNHPYARIIKDFYVVERDPERRPRVFGMTASPVDAKTTNVERAAEVLEDLLDSEIATIADPDLFKEFGGKTTERCVTYGPLERLEPTELCTRMETILGRHRQFRKTFVAAREAVTELGPWCADRLWQLTFRDDDSSARLEARTESELARETFGWRSGLAESLQEVREAGKLINDWAFLPPDGESLSSKTEKLLQILEENFKDTNTVSQCIVFVDRRIFAILLGDLVQQPSIRLRLPALKSAILMGAHRIDLEHQGVTVRRQQAIVSQFRRGMLNCLFATSVAEEGLDIPGCNLVVRFDLYETTIQYIQSRGRARMANSVFIHMQELGNFEHQRKLFQNHVNEQKIRTFCLSLPENRRIQRDQDDVDVMLKQEVEQRMFVVESTGAKLTYKQSLVVLAEFVASLATSSQGAPPTVEYTIVSAGGGGFQAEVLLPTSSPVRCGAGRVHRSKRLAKCSAAYETCLVLYKGGYLNAHFKSTYEKILPAMRNARLAITSKKQTEYDMRLKPDMWSRRGAPEKLFVTALVLSEPAAMLRPSRPLLMLTREPLPQIAEFPLFFGHGRRSEVRCIPLTNPMKPSGEELEGLCAFTLRIFWDVFSKDFGASAAELPYFLAPTTNEHAFYLGSDQPDNVSHDGESVSQCIDWETVRRVVEDGDEIPYNFDEPDDFFQDKYVTDPYDGSRKFFLRRVRRDLTPLDPIPDGAPAPRGRGWRDLKSNPNILNYSISTIWARSRARQTFSDVQPVVEAEYVSLRRNLLDEMEEGLDTQPNVCCLVLETLRISQLPVDVVAMAYNLPAIIYRLENNLIALDACKLLGLEVQPDLALVALTKDSDNSDEHDEEKINFQRGMGENYERLEFLGDTCLKMATTIAVFALLPDMDEYESHVERMLMLCNQNLFNHALDRKLQEYVRSKSFSRRTWYPPGLELKQGKQLETEAKHSLGDKTIADVCEALIGAAYLSGKGKGTGNSDMDMTVRAVSVMVKNKRHSMKSWDDYLNAYVPPEWTQVTPASPLQIELAQQIREKMGYDFKLPRLLRSAFMHPSYPQLFEHIPNYQRLEFLGDALLDMACVDHLYARFPRADPQSLTEYKMSMISNQFFGCLAVYLGFHRHIVLMQSTLQTQIADWVAKMAAAREEAEEEAVHLGRNKEDFARDFWLRLDNPPKCLADVIEAYVGAMFIDSGFDYATVESFFATHVLPWFPTSYSFEGADAEVYDGNANGIGGEAVVSPAANAFSSSSIKKHPAFRFANLLATRFGCTDHSLLIREIPDLEGDGVVTNANKVAAVCIVHGEVQANAVSASGRYAKLAVAKKAHALFADVAGRAEYRRMTGCACQPDDAAWDAAVSEAAARTAAAAEARREVDEDEVLRAPTPPPMSLQERAQLLRPVRGPRNDLDSRQTRLRVSESTGSVDELPW